MSESTLIREHGGYRNLRSFQVAQLIFDVTVRFCEKFIDKRSRTNDQMVQAARSGVQNIAEGSQASATSKKTEMKLTSVARASLEELKLDYEDFLRQRRLGCWRYGDERSKELVRLRLRSADEFAFWAKEVSKRDNSPIEEVAANGLLILLNVACTLLSRQLQAQAVAFERDGGFTERLYCMRSEARKRKLDMD